MIKPLLLNADVGAVELEAPLAVKGDGLFGGRDNQGENGKKGPEKAPF